MSWRGSRSGRAVRRLAIAALLVGGAARAQTTDVALGIEALARRDVKGAEAAFRRGTTAENALVHSASWQWLGHVAWKFRGDTAAAARYLGRALAEARDSSQVLLEIARLQGARHRYHDALRAARTSVDKSADAERRGTSARALISLAVDAAFSDQRSAMADSVDLSIVRSVVDTLDARVRRFTGRTSDAQALIDAGALLGDTTLVRVGLLSYVRLESGGYPTLGAPQAIVEDLRRARLHESAALVLRTTRPSHPEDQWVDLPAYAAYLRDIRSETDRIYRAQLAGTARPGDITRYVTVRGRRLWNEMQWAGEPAPEFFPAALYRRLRGWYGTYLSIERDRDGEELYLAHSVGIIEGGTEILDGVIASGMNDWILDGTGGRAGWVSGDTVYERRTAFTETPFRALIALTDPQTVPGELFRIARDSVGDIDRARVDSLGYYPGVAARIFRAGAQSLLDSVKAPERFTRSLFDLLSRTTIDLHESRHRADARVGRRQTPAQAEFRAKLDEVTGAALPKLAMTAILTPNIGDPSPHGQANRRIMIGLNRWIRRNGSAIPGYDASTPALLQLPLLSDTQLKAAFNSMRVP